MLAEELPEKVFWDPENPPRSVAKYLSAFMGEFDQVTEVESDCPYDGKASSVFRQIRTSERNKWYTRFDGLGEGCWAPKCDGILNNLTADLLAAAEFLGGEMQTTGSSALPGGIGADGRFIWIKLLDGGVGVDVLVSEHDYTNRVSGFQRTTIRGPKAYRVLCEFLGFDSSSRTLPGELSVPRKEEVLKEVDLLVASGPAPSNVKAAWSERQAANAKDIP
jgi:hypothetical protein